MLFEQMETLATMLLIINCRIFILNWKGGKKTEAYIFTSIGFKWWETLIEREISLPSFCVPSKPKIRKEIGMKEKEFFFFISWQKTFFKIKRK